VAPIIEYDRAWAANHAALGACLRLTRVSMSLPCRLPIGHPDHMPDRSFPAVQALVRRVQHVAANRPDPAHILVQTISMTGTIGMDLDVVLSILVEGRFRRSFDKSCRAAGRSDCDAEATAGRAVEDVWRSRR
jgi:hypothetical protein